jgi:hypothetical protein
MPAVSHARLPLIVVLVVVALLATATLTLAASSTAPAPAPAVAPETEQPFFVVPDVRRQAYVFAKGSLEQSGFAWKVTGPVQGFAANKVVAQSPAPGTRVVADGSPIVTLQLSRNAAYKEQGLPENESPYAGRPVRLVGAKPKTKPKAAPKPAATPQPAANRTLAAAAKPKPAAAAKARKPAFTVAGAPLEPADEIALPARAKQLRAWLEQNKTRTPRRVDHWLYQHNWIVTGARFGWFGGADALRVLIQVDRRVQQLWGVGGKSELMARQSLAEVEARLR